MTGLDGGVPQASAVPEEGGQKCGRGHTLTKDKLYRRPISGKLECEECRAEDRAKHFEEHPRPSNRKPRKPPLDPAVVEQLRAAAGLPPGGAS